MRVTQARVGYVLLAVGALLFWGKAEAGNRIHHNPMQPNVNLQAQGQIQGQKSINKSALSTVVSHNEKRRPVNSAYAPSMYSANECMGSTSMGGQGVNIGLSFGTTWTDEECALFKAASDFEQAGYFDDALVIRCKSKFAKDAPSCTAIRGE